MTSLASATFANAVACSAVSCEFLQNARRHRADRRAGGSFPRRAWARLIAKIYEVNPLVCPKCGSKMKVVAVIYKEDAINKMFRHLGLLAPPEELRAPSATGSPVASPGPERSVCICSYM